ARRARSFRSGAAGFGRRFGVGFPGRPEHPVHPCSGCDGPESRQPRRLRSRGGHRRCGEEDRGVAGMNNERILDTLRAPHISEKSARLAEHNQYVFVVAPAATKADVRAAVEEMFDVKVEQVNLVNTKGKVKSFRFRAGSRQGKRKAYVRLADGQTIDVSAKA